MVSRDGTIAVPAIIEAAHGRCVAAHFGAYDYLSSLNVAAARQSLLHPACDFARTVMIHACAVTNTRVSDGATNTLPVAIHRGTPLSPAQHDENTAAVHAAWKLHAAHVHHALVHGIFQGWDLHPAQLVARYGALYAYFLGALPAATERLTRFVARAAQATRAGAVFEDAATAQGLLAFFASGLECGALAEDDATATGLTVVEIRARSFLDIVEARR